MPRAPTAATCDPARATATAGDRAVETDRCFLDRPGYDIGVHRRATRPVEFGAYEDLGPVGDPDGTRLVDT
ncbi:hypothetical protein [Streptomyces sp. NPDC055749]